MGRADSFRTNILKDGRASRILMAMLTVFFVSSLVDTYALFYAVLFNKGLLSIFTFIAAYAYWPRVREALRGAGRDSAIAFIFAFLLFFAELLGTLLRLFNHGYDVKFTLWGFTTIIVCSVLAGVFAVPLFKGLFSLVLGSSGKERSRGELNRSFLIIWLLIFLAYIPCYLAFFPGIYAYDMVWQWGMYATGLYSTHHPLLHSWAAGAILELGKDLFGTYNAGLAIYSLLQLFILSGCLAFAVRYLIKRQTPRWVTVILTLFYILMPFFPVLGVSTTKDVCFGGFYLVSFVCICDMADESRIYGKARLILFGLIFLLTGLFRNNAVYANLAAIFCIFVLTRFRIFSSGGRAFGMRLTILVMIVSAITVGGFSVLQKVFNATSGSVAEVLSVPCQQLARTYVYHDDELSEEEKEELYNFIPEEALEMYTYFLSDPVKNSLDVTYLENHQKNFLSLWGKIGLRFPLEYIKAPLYNTMPLWMPGTGDDYSCMVIFEQNGEYFDDEHVIEDNSLLPGLREVYSWFQDVNIQRSLPLISQIFYPAFYTWMTILSFGMLIAKKRYAFMLPAFFLFGYMLSLLPGPTIIIRYVLPIMFCAPVYLIRALSEK